MKRPGTRLSIETVMTLIKAGAPDEQIIDHYRELHFDIRQVSQMIKRCKMKISIAASREQPKGTMLPIDPKQDWGMRVWRKPS